MRSAKKGRQKEREGLGWAASLRKGKRAAETGKRHKKRARFEPGGGYIPMNRPSSGVRGVAFRYSSTVASVVPSGSGCAAVCAAGWGTT
eukprot:439982-Prymnesium_polylepis.1